MSDQKDDKALEEYLQGGSELSRRYQAGKQAEPPKELDAAILKAARSAVTKKTGLRSRNWYVPLSLAAVVVIGVSVVFRMYEYKGQQLLSEPTPFFMLEEKSASGVSGENKNNKPAEPAAAIAPAPPAQQLKPEKDYLMRYEEIIMESPIRREAEKKSAEVSRQLEKEKSIQQAQRKQQPGSENVIPSMEGYSNRVIPARGLPVEQAHAPAEAAALSGAKPEEKYQTATQPVETGQLSDSITAGSRVMSETDWLAGIRNLWEAGKKDEAVAGLEQFLKTYPDYPHAEIITQLPGDFDPGKYISGFDKN